MILCRSGSINIVEFTDLCGALFRNSSGKPYWWESDLRIWMGTVNTSFSCSIDSSTITELFSIFNVSGDGSMSIEEFRFCYKEWIKKVSQ